MKRIGWLLSKLGSRRKSVRPVRAAEFLEVRALMDATMPELMAEVFTTEVTDGEVSPEVDPVAVEGEPTVFTIDMVKRTLTPTSEETTEETPVEKAEPVLLDAENPDVIFYSLGGESPAAPPVTLSHFESREQFGEYLIERALARYEYQFGQAAWWNRGPVYYDAVGGDVFFTAAANDSVVRSHSETNTQVNGVDEGDVVETDGTHLYLLRNDELILEIC